MFPFMLVLLQHPFQKFRIRSVTASASERKNIHTHPNTKHTPTIAIYIYNSLTARRVISFGDIQESWTLTFAFLKCIQAIKFTITFDGMHSLKRHVSIPDCCVTIIFGPHVYQPTPHPVIIKLSKAWDIHWTEGIGDAFHPYWSNNI